MTKANVPVTPDEYYVLTLHEVIESFGVPTDMIVEIVNEGIVNIESTEGDANNEWQFDNEACRRIRLVLQLRHDLGVNIAGAALALDLMNQIDELHALLAHIQSDAGE